MATEPSGCQVAMSARMVSLRHACGAHADFDFRI